MMKHLILAFSLLACPLAKGEILPRVAPEEVGLNSTQLIQADRAINEAIQKKQIPGAVLAVVRQGK
ncbi:MAG: esterase, partial [Bacteroidaceae bacterium]|nr:esterase [Bacteroidaceae bacterium]